MRRVLFVSKPVVPPFQDGTKCLVRDVGGRLSRHRAVLMSARGAPSLATVPGFPLPELVSVYSGSGAFTPRLAENARALLWLLVRGRADLLHFVFAPNARTSAAGRVVRTLRRVPVVQTVASRPARFAPSLFFGDVVVAQSEWTRERILAAFAGAGREPPRVEVVPPPVPELAAPSAARLERVRGELALPASATVIVYPGDLEVSRGAEVVAEVAPALSRSLPDAVVVFACRHKTARALEIEAALSSRLRGLPVRFARSVDLMALYGVSSAVVFPVEDLYGKVDLPISLLEAMRLGVPVVAFDAGPLRELEGAIRVPAGDATALAAEVVSLCSDPARSAAAVAAGKRAAEERYDAGVVARAYEAVYDSCFRVAPEPAPVAASRARG